MAWIWSLGPHVQRRSLCIEFETTAWIFSTANHEEGERKAEGENLSFFTLQIAPTQLSASLLMSKRLPNTQTQDHSESSDQPQKYRYLLENTVLQPTILIYQ